MSASETEYTPTTGDVRNVYGNFRWDIDGELEAEPEFDRWFARVRAEAQVKALREAVNGLTVIATGKINPRDLMDEADRIAREAGISVNDEQEEES